MPVPRGYAGKCAQVYTAKEILNFYKIGKKEIEWSLQSNIGLWLPSVRLLQTFQKESGLF